jgi:hypothetical protein
MYGCAGSTMSPTQTTGPGCCPRLAARADQGQGPPRPVVQAGRPVDTAAQVVQPRPRTVRGVRPPLPRGTQGRRARPSAGAPAGAGQKRDADAAHRDQACRDQPGRRACRPDQGLSRAVSPPTIGWTPACSTRVARAAWISAAWVRAGRRTTGSLRRPGRCWRGLGPARTNRGGRLLRCRAGRPGRVGSGTAVGRQH